MTEAREHDQKFLYHLKLAPDSRIVFDKAYTTYDQFAKCTAQQIRFVARELGNADFHVTNVMVDKIRKQKAKGVLKEQYVTVVVEQNGVVLQRLKLRRVTVLAEDGKVYVFLTNDFTLPPFHIATIVLLAFIKDTYKAWRKTYNQLLNLLP